MPDINEIAKICSTCGNCLFSCPVYNAELEEPNSPRGKVNLVKALMDGRLAPNRLNKKFVYQCLLCGSCKHTCPKGVEFVEMMVKYRNLISAGKKIPFLKKLVLIFYQSFLFRKLTPVVDLLVKTPLRKKLSLPVRRKTKLKKLLTPAKKGGNYDILLFPGCVLTYFYPALIEKIVEFLKGRGFSVVVPKNLHCCGFPYISQGWEKKFSALKKKNREIFSAFNFKYLLVPCSTGVLAFENYYDFDKRGADPQQPASGQAQPDPGREGEKIPSPQKKVREKEKFSPAGGIETYELTEFIYKFAKDAPVKLALPGEKKGKITYHDPCHDLKLLNIEKEPRYFMKQLGDDFVDDKSALCCGFGGIFSVGFPSTAEKILDRKEAVLDEIGAGTVVTSCPGCYFRLRENLSRDVKFFIELFPQDRKKEK